MRQRSPRDRAAFALTMAARARTQLVFAWIMGRPRERSSHRDWLKEARRFSYRAAARLP